MTAEGAELCESADVRGYRRIGLGKLDEILDSIQLRISVPTIDEPVVYYLERAAPYLHQQIDGLIIIDMLCDVGEPLSKFWLVDCYGNFSQQGLWKRVIPLELGQILMVGNPYSRSFEIECVPKRPAHRRKIGLPDFASFRCELLVGYVEVLGFSLEVSPPTNSFGQ